VFAITAFTVAQDVPSSRLGLARAIFGEAARNVIEVKERSSRDSMVSELAEAQARAGFISDSIRTAGLVSDRRGVLLKIAQIEAEHGEFDSAMTVVAGQDTVTQDAARLEIGIEQARRGDVTGAQATAAAMTDGYDKEQVLYWVAMELLRQGDRAGAQLISSQLKAPDHKVPDHLEPGFDWRIPAPPPAPIGSSEQKDYYGKAVADLQAGKLDAAVSCIERYENPADVSSRFARLSQYAAEQGNLDAALKFAEKVHISGADYEEGYLDGTLLPIGRLWAKTDSEAAISWARNRTRPYQRALALTGVAEGIATAIR